MTVVIDFSKKSVNYNFDPIATISYWSRKVNIGSSFPMVITMDGKEFDFHSKKASIVGGFNVLYRRMYKDVNGFVRTELATFI